MAGAAYIQECGPENINAKRRIYSDLEAVAAEDAMLASSTSGIADSQFTDHLRHPERFWSRIP